MSETDKKFYEVAHEVTDTDDFFYIDIDDTLTAESEGKTYRWTVDTWLEYDLCQWNGKVRA